MINFRHYARYAVGFRVVEAQDNVQRCVLALCGGRIREKLVPLTGASALFPIRAALVGSLVHARPEAQTLLRKLAPLLAHRAEEELKESEVTRGDEEEGE